MLISSASASDCHMKAKKMPGCSPGTEQSFPQIHLRYIPGLESADLYVAYVVIVRKEDGNVVVLQLPVLIGFAFDRQHLL